MSDVQWAKERSEIVTQLVYVDSSQRDMNVYPFPQSYKIYFDQPFRDVCGFELLDGSCPNSSYNIDVNFNDVTFTTQIPGNDVSAEQAIAYFNEIANASTFIDIFVNNITDQTFFFVMTQDQAEGYLAMLPLTDASQNYNIVVREQIINTGIVVYANQSPTQFYLFAYNTSDAENYALEITEQNEPLIAILELQNFYLVANSDGTVDITYYTFYQIDQNLYTAITSLTSNQFLVSINNYHQYITPGNTDIVQITGQLNTLLNDFGLTVNTVTALPNNSGKIFFTSPYPFIFNGLVGKAASSLGFNLLPTAVVNPSLYTAARVGTNNYLFQSVYDPVNLVWSVTTPGLLNLFGTRFVTLHIEELEDHLYGSYSYMGQTPGIGLLKFASPGALANIRFDFASVTKTEFHPIGKLSSLTISFTLDNGQLFNFNGIGHQLLFAVKYYASVPKKGVHFDDKILNPNYNPDLMTYMAKNQSIEYEEDSDDEEVFDEAKYYTMYKKALQENDYSSSSDSIAPEDTSPYTTDDESESEVDFAS